MTSSQLPDDCAKQWEILLLLLSSEEKKIDRTYESEVDTMTYFYGNEGIRKILTQWLQQMKSTYAKKTSELDTALKCDNVSLLWRQKGNDKFRANQIEECYRCYTKSVLYADQTGPMYSLALANRSAALLKMKKFKECLADVGLAIDSGYPSGQLHKLLLRKADCYIELMQRTDAQLMLTAAIEHTKHLNLSETHMLEFEKLVKILENKLETLGEAVPKEDDIVLPECYMGMNPSFNAASNAIELSRSEAAGRFVVTRHATGRGDVLFSEEPYAWVTLPGDHALCEMCCQTDINPLPCTYCSRSIYCGQSCRSQAWPAFHRWECVGAQSELFPTIGIAHLALRVLLLTASEGFPELPLPINPFSPLTAADVFQNYSSVDKIEIYKTETPPFLRMFNLVTNFDKMINTDYIQYALTATMLTLYLEQFTSFFDALPARVPAAAAAALRGRPLRVFAAALVLRALGQLVCNGHATLGLAACADADAGAGRTMTEKEVRRATAIYPSAAMMNHSCDPNIINVFHKRRLIVRGARELAAGAQVFNCYGPHRAREPAARRRRLLRAQYMFTCRCDACADAGARDAVLVFSAYACQACKGPVLFRDGRAQCQQCPAPFPLQRALALIDRADELMQQAERAGSAEQRCRLACAAYRLRQQAWHRHHTALRAAADHLARLYADLGEFSRSIELIKQNIQSLEHQYGSFSVEVTHEIRKLSDVMFERIISSPQHQNYGEWCSEALKITRKAAQLAELHYGGWEPLAARLRAREAALATRAPAAAPPAAHYNLKI